MSLVGLQMLVSSRCTPMSRSEGGREEAVCLSSSCMDSLCPEFARHLFALQWHRFRTVSCIAVLLYECGGIRAGTGWLLVGYWLGSGEFGGVWVESGQRAAGALTVLAGY